MQRISATRDLTVLYLSMLLTRVGFGAIIIIFPYYLRSGAVTVGVVLSLYPLLEGLTATPIGRYCDLGGRRRVFLTALFSMAVMTLMIGMTRNVYVISTVHAAEGVAAAGITVSTLAMITDLTESGHRGAGMGLFDFSNLGGYAAGIFLGGVLVQVFKDNLGYCFYVTAAALTVAAAISLFLLKEPPHLSGRNTPLNPLKTLDARTRALLPLWLGVTIMLGLIFYLPSALRRVGVHPLQSSLLLVAGVFALGVGSVGFGALSDRVGRHKVMLLGVVGLLGTLLSLALLARAPSFTGAVARYWFVVAPFALAATAIVPSILALLGDRSKTDSRGLAMGLYSMMLSFGIAIGNVVGGLADAAGGLGAILDWGAAIFALACLSSLLLSLLYRAGPAQVRSPQGVPEGPSAAPQSPS
ncbi:MAG TPA: MFS transporter [Conexivisphaerales archaeon]|nr:MFS transporter [Conexivisphaerales archaeon]